MALLFAQGGHAFRRKKAGYPEFYLRVTDAKPVLPITTKELKKLHQSRSAADVPCGPCNQPCSRLRRPACGVRSQRHGSPRPDSPRVLSKLQPMQALLEELEQVLGAEHREALGCRRGHFRNKHVLQICRWLHAMAR